MAVSNAGSQKEIARTSPVSITSPNLHAPQLLEIHSIVSDNQEAIMTSAQLAGFAVILLENHHLVIDVKHASELVVLPDRNSRVPIDDGETAAIIAEGAIHITLWLVMQEVDVSFDLEKELLLARDRIETKNLLFVLNEQIVGMGLEQSHSALEVLLPDFSPVHPDADDSF